MEDLNKQLTAILEGEVIKIKSNSDKIAKKHAQKLAKTVKAASHYDENSEKKKNFKGHYKDGWRTRKGYTNIDHYEYEVYNAKKYQLTHLLEHGHIAANGVRVGIRPHINANAETEIESFIEDMKEHCTDDT